MYTLAFVEDGSICLPVQILHSQLNIFHKDQTYTRQNLREMHTLDILIYWSSYDRRQQFTG